MHDAREANTQKMKHDQSKRQIGQGAVQLADHAFRTLRSSPGGIVTLTSVRVRMRLRDEARCAAGKRPFGLVAICDQARYHRSR